MGVKMTLHAVRHNMRKLGEKSVICWGVFQNVVNIFIRISDTAKQHYILGNYFSLWSKKLEGNNGVKIHFPGGGYETTIQDIPNPATTQSDKIQPFKYKTTVD